MSKLIFVNNGCPSTTTFLNGDGSRLLIVPLPRPTTFFSFRLAYPVTVTGLGDTKM